MLSRQGQGKLMRQLYRQISVRKKKSNFFIKVFFGLLACGEIEWEFGSRYITT